MYEIRLFEEALYRAFLSEKMPGTMHQAIGQEAVSVGVMQALEPGDVVTSTHRGHGHAIAKGVSLNALMAEMYAKSTGTSHGVGGSLHIYDLSRGFLGTNGIVGGGVPIAVGAALGLRLDNRPNIAVAFFGEGAANHGSVHEALNLAAVWKLPIVFVCENNFYAVSTPMSHSYAIQHVAERATAYGMPGCTVDGNDVLAVFTAASEAGERARGDGGPSLVECETYRHKGHSRFEPATYRPKEEVENWMARDPIARFRQYLLEQELLTTEGADAIKQEVQEEIRAAIAYAKSSPEVEPSQIARFVYA
jgi:TPP-dependent pyruvate/acetoin dehydrogenase alpha subunit